VIPLGFTDGKERTINKKIERIEKSSQQSVY
jgi:hypothetical protein